MSVKQVDETIIQFFSNNVTIYFYVFRMLVKHKKDGYSEGTLKSRRR